MLKTFLNLLFFFSMLTSINSFFCKKFKCNEDLWPTVSHFRPSTWTKLHEFDLQWITCFSTYFISIIFWQILQIRESLNLLLQPLIWKNVFIIELIFSQSINKLIFLHFSTNPFISFWNNCFCLDLIFSNLFTIKRLHSMCINLFWFIGKNRFLLFKHFFWIKISLVKKIFVKQFLCFCLVSNISVISFAPSTSHSVL